MPWRSQGTPHTPRGLLLPCIQQYPTKRPSVTGCNRPPGALQAVLELVKLKPTVIRGNASEIMAVAGAVGVTTKGVDSTAEAEDALELGKRLAVDAGCIVAVSGATDLAS